MATKASKKQAIFKQLQENFLFAVVRGKTEEDGYEISKSVYEGGFKNIEVTFSTPNADRVMARLAEEYAGTDMVVGAGTVLDAITARISILAGAQFIVSPTLVPEIAKVCNLYAIPYLPGCGTVTEVQQALELGCEVVKLFPGGGIGSSFIKDVHGPIPWVEMMPSGGVNLDNMSDWMAKGAWAVGVGSALSARVKEGGYATVAEEAKKFSDRLAEIRQG